ncbi:tRNA threonylcarbamoyladenosine biosynthesis protein TsaB [hydrothermal vent metagenome]|uniref:tRNA threonylcarbamoyladenosine biosynthesis protein TsaB n=1 Tax=hydrothermal vent metagenome TaxID=652676 RepID=A0A3B0SDD8_9ZZZZ
MVSRLLAIDTVTSACSVALFEDQKLIAQDYQEIGRGHAERLIPMIEALPNRGKAEKILVNCGPGSFTGVRIGISAAKALALAWNSELSGYQCLQLVAAQAQELAKNPDSIYVAMIGGHGEYFVQNFSASGEAKDALQSLSATDALGNAQSNRIAGNAAAALAELSPHFVTCNLLPKAAHCLLISEQDRYLNVAPVYGRAPDAVPAKAR